MNLETECEKWDVGMRVFIKDCKSCGVYGGVDRHGVPTVTSVLIGSRSWLYNINIQPL